MRDRANPPSPEIPYAGFIERLALAARGSRKPPATSRNWDDRLAAVRHHLNRSLGRLPEESCPLEPEILGTLVRDGYAIERLTFQSWPEVRITANLYRPEPAHGRYPGVLSVHG